MGDYSLNWHRKSGDNGSKLVRVFNHQVLLVQMREHSSEFIDLFARMAQAINEESPEAFAMCIEGLKAIKDQKAAPKVSGIDALMQAQLADKAKDQSAELEAANHLHHLKAQDKVNAEDRARFGRASTDPLE